MRIDPEDLRRHYESLSDEGFLDIDRSDLARVAQGIYDQEIARRGLDHPPEQEMEAFHRPLPIFKVGADRDIASELRADTDAGPPQKTGLGFYLEQTITARSEPTPTRGWGPR